QSAYRARHLLDGGGARNDHRPRRQVRLLDHCVACAESERGLDGLRTLVVQPRGADVRAYGIQIWGHPDGFARVDALHAGARQCAGSRAGKFDRSLEHDPIRYRIMLWILWFAAQSNGEPASTSPDCALKAARINLPTVARHSASRKGSRRQMRETVQKESQPV